MKKGRSLKQSLGLLCGLIEFFIPLHWFMF